MLTGYSGKLTARPGETISFKVSSDARTLHVDFVRLIHGDADPRGPGRKEIRIASDQACTIRGHVQPTFPGSHASFPDHPVLRLTGAWTITLWIFPTRIGHGRQTLLCKGDREAAGYELGLTEAGHLALRIGAAEIVGRAPVREHHWHWVAATQDPASGTARIFAGLHRRDLSVVPDMGAAGLLPASRPASGPLLIAAFAPAGHPVRVFNGKIADPCLFGRCLGEAEIAALHRGDVMAELPQPCLAAWDFSHGPDGTGIRDVSGNAHHGVTHQSPVRAMTGPHWDGAKEGWHSDRRAYSAMHFHEDSLTDAGWGESFTFTVPGGLASGVYAARISAGSEVDHLPFAVCPPQGTRGADLALLLPTFTYLAYGNELMGEQGLNCLYDRYTDGAGVPYASCKHPIKTFRPGRGILRSVAGERFARHLGADLYFVSWLHEIGKDVDILTDHDLDREGLALLAGYKAVATGSHPEDVSARILDALEGYVARGGSLAYLGGNGFYWVTTLAPDGSLIEVRRPSGTRPWTSEPGEAHHAMTGERGGLWRTRGRAPQRLTGVGFAAQGWTSDDRCGLPRPYDQVGDRADPLVAEVLDGIAPGARIGDFPTLGLGHGAAGDEVDRADAALGTPVQAKVIATATGFTSEYQLAIEERAAIHATSTLADDPLVRADIVIFAAAGGGLVFSVGSMQWFSALSHNAHDNTVARLTRNVLDRMLR